jgi:ketosteroid isomerase-like protein
MIYRAIVKRRARGIFANLSRGDWKPTTADIADDVHHVFPGANALGGERHSREAMERWFERLYRLLPEIEFDVRDVAVRGWPWDTAVAIHAYLDAEKVTELLDSMAAAGVDEATAAPVTG